MEDNHTDTVKSRDIEIKERKNVSILRRSNLEKYLSLLKLNLGEINMAQNSSVLKSKRPKIYAQYAQNIPGHEFHRNDCQERNKYAQ